MNSCHFVIVTFITLVLIVLFVVDAVLSKWLKLTSDDVKEQIYKLAKKGLTPSQIGEQNTEHTGTVIYPCPQYATHHNY